MKYLFLTSFVLLIFVGVVRAPVVHAESLTAQLSGINSTQTTVQGTDVNGATLPPLSTVDIQAQADALQAAAKTPITGDTKVDDSWKGLSTVMTWIMTLFAWLLGIAAITLDNAVYYTIVKMGDYISHLSAIGVTWRILRDIANIMFIFGFIGAGIATILKVDNYGWTTKMLPMLLVGAVFLNFSLFFTEALVDVSNLFATQFYQQINGGAPAGTQSVLSATDIANNGISSKIMNQIGLQTIYAKALTGGQVFAPGSSIIIGFMGIILFMVTAFVMFALAFILIARFVALIFFMLLSPVGFMGLAIPQMKHRASQWWEKFFAQIITAPVLMLLLYVALAVITDANFIAFGTSKADWTSFISESANGHNNIAGFASIMLAYLVAMGLLLVVVIKAKSMSAFGAGKATEWAGKASFGVTAWGVNRTVGRGAYRLQRVARQNAKFNKFDVATGRAFTRTFDRFATGSFDLRSGLSKLPGGASVNAGEVAKDGFVGARKRSIEDHEKAVKTIETAHKEAVFTQKDKDIALANAKAEAQTTHEKAKTKRETIERRTEAEKAAVKKHEEDIVFAETTIEGKRRMNIAVTSEDEAKLELARANLKTSQDTLAVSKKELTEAGTSLVAAAKAIKDLETEEGKKKAHAAGLAKNIKESKKKYAEGLEWLGPASVLNPFHLVMFGPNTDVAARKIRESMEEKGKKDKIIDLLRGVVEDEGEGAKDKGGDKGSKTEGGAKPTGDAHH